MRTNFEVIVTVNERTHNAELLRGMKRQGATIFRINGSHVAHHNVGSVIHYIRKALGYKAKILIDLPGSKIRFRHLEKEIKVKKGKLFRLKRSQFNFPEIFDFITKDHLLLSNDGNLPFKLHCVNSNEVEFMSLISGVIRNGKGVNVRGKQIPFPFLEKSDCQLIETAIKHKIDYIGFSYVRNPQDIREAEALLRNTYVKPIYKIETAEACDQLNKILPLTSTILIDRGDLSGEIGLHRIPGEVKRIVKSAKARKIKVLLATQFLFYMVSHPIPSISEVVALHDAIEMADGLQLSEETAIGLYPLQALETIQQALRVIR